MEYTEEGWIRMEDNEEKGGKRMEDNEGRVEENERYEGKDGRE